MLLDVDKIAFLFARHVLHGLQVLLKVNEPVPPEISTQVPALSVQRDEHAPAAKHTWRFLEERAATSAWNVKVIVTVSPAPILRDVTTVGETAIDEISKVVTSVARVTAVLTDWLTSSDPDFFCKQVNKVSSTPEVVSALGMVCEKVGLVALPAILLPTLVKSTFEQPEPLLYFRNTFSPTEAEGPPVSVKVGDVLTIA
jgi:hypothetical protein